MQSTLRHSEIRVMEGLKPSKRLPNSARMPAAPTVYRKAVIIPIIIISVCSANSALQLLSFSEITPRAIFACNHDGCFQEMSGQIKLFKHVLMETLFLDQQLYFSSQPGSMPVACTTPLSLGHDQIYSKKPQ